MNTVQIKLYDIFRIDLQLSDAKAAALVQAVEEVVEQKERENNHSNATKDDIRLVQKDIHQLELKIEQSKNDMYKAIFLSGLIQFLGILGGLIAIVKFMK